MHCLFRYYLRKRYLLFFLVTLVADPSLADGVFIPPEAVEILPEMPQQRALIIWRDGVQQLLVESDFDGAGERMAWIVPVPAEPTDVAVGAAGVFDVLKKGLAPKTARVAGGTFALALLLFVWCCCQWAVGKHAPGRVFACTLACFGLFFFLFMTTPTMYMTLGDSMGDGPGLSDGAEVLAERVVGNYDVTTVRAESAAALVRWLSENGFRALPEEGEAIVSEYIAEGWCFVAAQLQRDGLGYTRPHPLSITFPAEQPVYPMRLTRLADTNLLLDLYVIADRRAQAANMETVYCERFRRGEQAGVEKVWGSWYSKASPDSVLFPTAHAGGSMGYRVNKTTMALPWLVEHMQDKDVLTHLRAQVPTDAMHQDIAIDFRRFSRTRPRLMLPEERWAASIGYGLCAFGLVLGLGLRTHYKRISQNRKPLRRRYALLGAVFIGLAVSRIPAWTTTPGQQQFYDRYDRRSVDLGDALNKLAENAEILERLDKVAIERYLLECLTYPKAGAVAPGDFLGEGPGRFEIVEDERGTLLRTYGKANDFFSAGLGLPLEYPLLTPEGKAAPSARMLRWSDSATLSVDPSSVLEFGHVPAGEQRSLTVVLSNRGGPIVVGNIHARPPFYVREEESEYTLRAGTSLEVEIAYSPKDEDAHEVEIEFSGNDSHSLYAYGLSYVGRPATENVLFDDRPFFHRRSTNIRGRSVFRKTDVAIHNDNAYAVDLAGWGISNDPADPFKHTFPENTIIAPEDFLVVYLVAQPQRPGRGYSAGFELQQSTNGYLGLSNPQGEVVAETNYTPVAEDRGLLRGLGGEVRTR